MLTMRSVSKRYQIRQGHVKVLDNIDLTIAPGEKIGVLGRNGSGKSTLIRLLSGAERPTKGTVQRSMTVSWPLAFAGGFQGSLTGYDNLRFISRVYGIGLDDKVSFVEEFSELGRFLREPVKTYSSGMRARLAFALSMAIDFDCFLIDEVITVGDSRFHDKCREELFKRRGDRAMVMVSHEQHNIRDHCKSAYVLHTGKLYPFEDLDAAYSFYAKS